MIHQNSSKCCYIPLDEKSYLTQEDDGQYYLWDLQGFPHSQVLCPVTALQTKILIKGGAMAEKLLYKIYEKHPLQMEKVSKQVARIESLAAVE